MDTFGIDVFLPRVTFVIDFVTGGRLSSGDASGSRKGGRGAAELTEELVLALVLCCA